MPLPEEDLSVINDPLQLRNKRSARKGIVTRLYNDAGITRETSLRHLNLPDLQTRMEKVERHQELFERIQERIESLTTAEDQAKDQATVDDQRSGIQTIQRLFRSTLATGTIYRTGALLKEEVEAFTRRKDFANPQALTVLEQLEAQQRLYRESLFGYDEHKELQEHSTFIRDTLTSMRERVEDCIKAAAAPLPLVASPAPTASKETPQRRSKIKIELPTFDGNSLKWTEFWNLFSRLVSKETDLSDEEKTYLIIQAMKDKEAENCARTTAANTYSYDEVVSALKRKYDRPRANFLLHHKALLQKRRADYNYKAIEDLLQHFQQLRRGFVACKGYSAEQLLAAHMEESFGEQLRHEWDVASIDITDPPTMGEVIEFLEKQMANLSAMTTKTPNIAPKQRNTPKSNGHVYRIDGRRNEVCPACEGNGHPLHRCPTFMGWDLNRRHQVVRSSRLCWNCLSPGHQAKDCSSRFTCRECRQPHHTLLHKSSAPSEPPPTTETTSSPPSPAAASLNRLQTSKHAALLCTAMADVLSKKYVRTARIFMDPGATVSLISKKLVNTLQLPKRPLQLTLNGWGGGSISNYVVDVRLQRVRSYGGEDEDSVEVTCHVVDAIPPDLTYQDTSKIRKLPVFKGRTPLADPGFGGVAPFDILLGMGDSVLCHRGEIVYSADGCLQLTNTIFGWTVGGRLQASSPATVMRISVAEKDDLLSRLWEREETPDQLAVNHYLDHYHRLLDGRYSVKLPRKDPTPTLGESRSQALKRYLQNERSLKKRNQLEPFEKVLDEYEELDHAEKVPAADLEKPQSETFYLPMHGVVKESSSTTKLRIVFDASAKSTTGVSLNDTLLPGPSLYPLLTSVLIRFRQHAIALTSDISKMFREVVLDSSERDYHRFLRRKESQLEDWRMKRLTFGVSSSPYLASQVLRQVAVDHQAEYPKASEVIRTSFYVDDCLTGTNTVEEASSLQHQLCALLKQAGMTLRKWRSNSAELLETIPEELREKSEELHVNAEPSTSPKALGVHWNSTADVLSISMPTVEDSEPTKRSIASAVARLYDVLGWMAPTTLFLKVLLQKLWELHLDWDETAPESIAARWERWKIEVPLLANHTLPRRYLQGEAGVQDMQLHGFSDASQQGYGGVIYLRVLYSDSTIGVSLVIAKTRVAPLKTLSIPKLELCGAQLTASFGRHGSKLGKLNYPTDVAFDDAGHVYVVHQDNHRVQKFSPRGEPLMTFGTRTAATGKLSYPQGIHISQQFVYVTEQTPSVSVFTTNGEFVTSFGSKEELNDASGITADEDGFLYVCSWNKSQVVVY